jgi:LysR family transcriptional regulator, low CO2-responsive transcriptional regulator
MANPLVLVAPADHRLARRRTVALAELRDERFVLRERGSGTRIAVDAHFKRLRFTPTVRLELGSNEAVRESVAGHLGLSVLSVHALGARHAEHGIVALRVQGFPIPSQWHVVQRRARRRSPLAQAFEAHLFEEATPILKR